MKLTLKIKNIQDSFKRNPSSVFWLLFGLAIIFDIFVLQHSVLLIFQSHKNDNEVNESRIVRINFAGFDKVLETISQAQVYSPKDIEVSSPFGFAPDKKK